MMGFSVLFRKELHELLRTGRAAVTLILYLLIGLGSPLLAMGLPWLLSHIPEDQLGGMELIITQDPALSDAMAQYLKNLGLIPLLVVLLGMGAVNGERRSGLLAVILSRPVSRRAVLAAKALSTGLLHVTGTVIAAAGCALYSQILFGGLWMPGFLAMNGVILLLNLLFAALTLLASVLTPSPGPAAALGIGGFALVSTLAALPSIGRWTPAALQIVAGDLASGRVPVQPLLGVGLSFGLLLGLLLAADRLFARQELG